MYIVEGGSLWHKVVAVVDPQTPLLRADLLVHPGLESDWFKGDAARFIYGGKFVLIRNSLKYQKKVTGSNLK